ncbi:hypothetical protein DNTS_014310 [Danionella cerebrum]|uniref:TSC22 domain family protein 4 n=1 Tax=Danionella cerebrum TaxID=2873325 RepID=A0A553N4D6_9TELE|nr:hypothetical protein DNTS_014310 [Danionella translucida]TRY60296.1 hypothetical protein DNTS_014310 [Danionella translucida]
MSGGKKRSGFQITSVTSDYNQSSAENHSVELTNPASQQTPPASAKSPPHGSQGLSATLSNGPSLRQSPALQTQLSSSQPTTPVTARKQSSLDAGASRFRVVRLDQGSGEPYKRGRWTCLDVMEREFEERGLRRVIDSMRHAHSLESLETVGMSATEGAMGGARFKPLLIHGDHMVHSQGTSHLLTQCRADYAHSGPPSPTHSHAHFDSKPTAPQNMAGRRSIPAPLRLDMDAVAKLRTTRSQPTSPGVHRSQDVPFSASLTPVQTPSALALAQSVFGMSRALQLVEDDGGRSACVCGAKGEARDCDKRFNTRVIPVTQASEIPLNGLLLITHL